MKHYFLSTITLCILFTTVCTFCACDEPTDAPTLLEPLAQIESYRPVERHTVGTLHVEIGNVTPREYCHSYKKVTDLKEINVQIGQYVKKGDILATADIEKLSDELKELENERTLLMAQHIINEPVYGYTKEILELEKEGYLNESDFINDGKIATQLETEAENFEYDEKLYSYLVTKYTEKIAELHKQIADGSLYAKADGYVTYIKDTSKGNTVNIGEAVVIIADYNDLHLEVNNLTTADNKYKQFNIMYALIDGKEVNITEDEYTPAEIIYAKSQDSYPNIRYIPTDQTPLTIGKNALLFFMKTDHKDELCVGNDSINSDENGDYVYVKTSDEKKEKRYVTLSSGDEYYTPIIEGLTEGEEVYYSQDSIAPSNYTEYLPVKSNFTNTVKAKQFKTAEINNTAFISDSLGTVSDVYVSQGDKISKGDVLMTIDTGGGSAKIAEANTDLKHLDIDISKALYDHDRNIWDLNAEIRKISKDCFEEKLCEPEYLRLRNILEDKIQLEEIAKVSDQANYNSEKTLLSYKSQKIKKNNNGNGTINIIAESDGIISHVFVHKGNVIDEKGKNKLLATMTKETDSMAQISMSKGEEVNIGANVSICVGNTDNPTAVYPAKCISSTKNNKSYAYTEDGKAAVSKIINDATSHDYSVITFEDPNLLETINIKDCTVFVENINSDGLFVIPGNLVHREESHVSSLVKNYVWKIQNGNLVKQFVITGTDYNIGNNNNVVVLMGINEGDVLAME